MIQNDRDAGIDIVMNALKDTKYGLSITEISRKSGMNRNSAAKYLAILVTLGQVEMQIVGPARVYHLSSRIPMSSAALNRFPDPIISVSDDGTVRKINKAFQICWNIEKNQLAGVSLKDVPLPALREIADFSEYRKALDGEAAETNIWKKVSGGSVLYWLSPAVFDDGSLGVIISLRKNE
ncbi:helix-turn-helix domain-containing protein [Methanorbis rubei]